jgi:hypothetical protein
MYEGWRARKRKVLKYLLLFQGIVLLVMVPTLTWAFASVVVPLYLFSVAVLAYATYRYARDGDWEVIHIVFGANLRDIIALMMSPEFARRYELTPEDSRQLAAMINRPEAIGFVQGLFASHRIIDSEPSARNKRLADVLLLLLGAVIGGIAQHRLSPPAGAHVELWHLSPAAFIVHESFRLAIIMLLVATVVGLNILGNRRMENEHRMLERYARERPIPLLMQILPSTAEVRRKIREAVQWTGRMSGADMSSVVALENITGAKITKGEPRKTALGDMQWTVLLFDMGIMLGVALPPLLGIG